MFISFDIDFKQLYIIEITQYVKVIRNYFLYLKEIIYLTNISI